MKIYLLANNVQVLGPYNRFVIWVQGCHKRCPDCISPDSRDLEKGKEYKVQKLKEMITMSNIEGITISGGEPFLQAEELADLIKEVRSVKEIGVIVYTGFQYKEIKENKAYQNFLSEIDLLIDGEYIKDLDDGLSLRGSSNQQIIPLTERYASIIDEYYGIQGRKSEIQIKNKYIKIIGIPSDQVKKIISEMEVYDE